MSARATCARGDSVLGCICAERRSYLSHSAAECSAVGRAAGSPVPGLPSDKRVAGVVDIQRVWGADSPGTAIRQRLRIEYSPSGPQAKVSTRSLRCTRYIKLHHCGGQQVYVCTQCTLFLL